MTKKAPVVALAICLETSALATQLMCSFNTCSLLFICDICYMLVTSLDL